MYINPGELKKQIQIIKPSIDEYDSDGFPVTSETVVRTCKARMTDTSGSEIIQADSEFSQAKRRFLVRYTNTEITTAMKVRYNSKDYDIVYVNPYGDSKEYIEIWTEISERNVM